MIVSHKHKFIFIKTHKTATQTFYNVIKPHLGDDDILIGDEQVPSPDGKTMYDTSLNVNTQLPGGCTGGDIRDRMGNHIPWFTIRDAIGEDVWNDYTKFTIERPARDRIVSLFCFLNPLLVRTRTRAHPSMHQEDMERVRDIQSKTPLENEPDNVRKYFEMWTDVQLECPVLDLMSEDTYSASVVAKERDLMKQTAKRLGHDVFFYDRGPRSQAVVGQTCYRDFPPLSEHLLVSDGNFNNTERKNVYKRYLSYEGQCRFLNYGYYHDGDQLQIDKVLNFKPVVTNVKRLNTFFTNHKININLTQHEWNDKSLNTQFRSKMDRWGIAPLPKTDWWYQGTGGKELENKINNKFNFIKY